jgi:chorismate mutase
VANSSFSLETIKNTVQSNILDINRLVNNTLKANNDVTEIKANANKNNVIDDKNVDIAASVSAQKVEELFADDDFMEEFYDGIFEETDKVNSFVKGNKKLTKSYVDIFMLKDAKTKIMAFCANYDAADTPEKQEELVKQYSIEMFTYICDQMSTFGMDKKDEVVVGQKITDFILNKCTPFAFEGETFAKYGDKYGVKDNSLLESIAEAKGYGSTKEEFIESIKQELGVVESKEDKKETIPNLKDDIDEKVNDNKPSPVIDEQIKEVPSINSTK